MDISTSAQSTATVNGNGLIGQVFGHWTILEYAGSDSNWNKSYRARCVCGKEKVVQLNNLKTGASTNCGCIQLKKQSARQIKDMTGQRFGRLTVVKFAGKKRNYATWECKCDCGGIRIVARPELVNGDTNSCGCLKRENLDRVRPFKHGMSKSPEYGVWDAIKTRCFNPNDDHFKDYGARGITMCDKWRNSFEAFYSDMGPRPSDEHSIDRIDNNGNYEKDNCRWATTKEQARNRRDNVLLTHNGKTQPMSAWEEEMGLGKNVIGTRIRAGWSIPKAIETP